VNGSSANVTGLPRFSSKNLKLGLIKLSLISYV